MLEVLEVRMPETMTAQEVFDQAIGGVLAQGARAEDDDSQQCLYRKNLEDGRVLKCAAGQLVTDEELETMRRASGTRNGAWGHLSDNRDTGSRCDPERLHAHMGLIQGLQRAHDVASGVAEVARNAREIAATQRLSTRVIDEWEQTQQAQKLAEGLTNA